jgi:NADPH2:quinone reductase
MRAIFTDPNTSACLTFRETTAPTPAPSQALIKVAAFSLNQGETRTALAAAHSYIPGWDFAGVIQRAAADGSTPKEGARVFGFVAQGSWAEYIAVPCTLMAEIPDGVTNAQAAALPIAGVTAQACLEVAGALSGRRVLITGAAGGVGRFACQLAALAGAKVFAISRRPDLQRRLQEDGVEPAGVFTTMAEAKAAGQYDVILDSVGGDTLAIALTALARDGVCVNCGNSSRQPTSFDIRAAGWPFHHTRCIWLGRELPPDSTPMLAQLIHLVKLGYLRTPIDAELPWTSVAEAAERLIQQSVNGKIVLNVV